VLSVEQEEALADLFQIRCATTIPSLSELTGHRIVVSVPTVKILPVNELTGAVAELADNEVAAVHQAFSGTVPGDALFALLSPAALNLTNLLSSDRPVLPHLDASDCEALTEVANNLINVCLGVVSELLHAQVVFALPRLYQESLSVLLHGLMIGEDDQHHGLVLTVDFSVSDSTIRSYLIVILDNVTTDRLFDTVRMLG
jgi:chemotaxis protein CheC